MTLRTATATHPESGSVAPGSSRDRATRWARSHLAAIIEHVALAVLAYVPQLLSQPGVTESDTKSYLYIDPGRFIRQSASMWDPKVALGTVTHEQIGYLFPMGPFFWLTHTMGVPVWVAQRLWVGTILFAAAAGVMFLARTLSLRGPGRFVAAFAFMISPYVLQYLGRMSVILLAWAGLPWMVAFIALALSRGGWRYPALFAIVVAAVSGVNASALLYVGLAPVLWLPYSVLVTREHTWGEAWSVLWRVGLLTSLVSLWWAAGLQVEAAYGVDILKYTETVPAVSETSTAAEVIRGLGYWYFYGGGRLGPWVSSSVQLTQQLWTLAMSFAVPALAFLAAAVVRWRHRAYFVFMLLVGMIFAVGAYPFTHPSFVGGLLKAFMTDTTAGLAMRSTDRASPLVVLAIAMLLGAGISALARIRPIAGALTALVVIGIVAAANPPIWNGSTVADHFTQPSPLPRYVYQAARWLDSTSPGTRVLAIPGQDFAAYRFGDTIDPIWPGLLTRPFVTREQQVMGSLPTQDVLYAFDEPMQQGTLETSAIAPMARLMSAGDILLQNDLAYERYNTPRPRDLYYQLDPPPPGLGQPVGFGTPRPNVSLIPIADEQALSQPTDRPWPSPLVAFPVADPRPIVRAEPSTAPLIIDGNASGIADAAAVGLLANNPTVLYAGTLDSHPHQLEHAVASGADLVLTDTNAKRGFRWNTLQANAGYVETAAQKKDTYDPTDAPLDIFPGAPKDAQTTAVLQGIASVSASAYGNPITYTPEDQPFMAVDGNLNTAWVTSAFSDPVGQWWQERFLFPVTTTHVNLVQPLHGNPDRWITRVTLRFDGHHPYTIDLGPASRTAAGQTLTFPRHTFSTLRITIDAVSASQLHSAGGLSPVGFAEVGVAGVHAKRVISLPQDLLRRAGASSQHDRLTIIMSRNRVAPYPPRSDPEREMTRTFWLPTARTFSLSGTARISALIPDNVIDRLVGRPGSNGSGVVAYSKGRLPGDLHDTASSALDGKPSTIWSPGFGTSHQVGDWIEVNLPHPITFDHLNLQVVADGFHSVPTSLRITTQSGSVNVSLPPIADGRQRGDTVAVPVHFTALTGSHIKITVTGARIEYTKDYYSEFPIGMPLGIAELGIPGVSIPPPPTNMPATCQSNLLTIDGKPVWLRVVGTTSHALDGGGLALEPCGPDSAGIRLGPGNHTVQAANGHLTGFNIDQLVLDSAPGGAAAADPPGRTLTPPSVAPAPAVRVTSQSATTIHLAITGLDRNSTLPGNAAKPFWLVLGQSFDRGWQAYTSSGLHLRGPELVDGFANGWMINPATLTGAAAAGSLNVTLRFVPQGRVWVALGASGMALMACLLLAVWPRRWWARHRSSKRSAASRTPASHPPARRNARWIAQRAIAKHGRHSLRRTPLSTPEQAPSGPVAVADMDTAPVEPAFASPFTTHGGRPPWWQLLLLATGAALVTGAVSAPLTGFAVGLAVALALAVAPGRFILSIGALALVTGAGLYVVVHQASGRFFPGDFWPPQFDLASTMVWMGVSLLVADAVVELGRLRQAGRHRRP
ncbi:MAG: alpha-(1-_3)-arabinofuranosyltransferase domain-containing protein [Acidimicrobiales bacterium]